MTQIKLLEKQKEFVGATEPEVIFSGGYGSGKSVSLCVKAVFLSLRYPRNRIFIGRKYLQSFKQTTYKTLLEGDGEMPAILPKEYIEVHNKTDRTILLKNGSEIVYSGVEIEQIKSLNLAGAFIDECGELTQEEWDAFNGRMRLAGVPVRQVCGATNPYSEYHWIWNKFRVNPPKKDNIPTAKLIQMATDENYYLPKEYIENLKRTLFGFYYQRYVDGIWVGADTLVFPNFDHKTHIIPPFEIPKSWPRFRSIDFGYRSPFSCGWFTVVKDSSVEHNLQENDIILYREMYYTERTAAINAQKIKEFSVYPDGEPEKISWTVCDWDAGDRADLESVGIRTVKADKKDKASRLQKVRQALGNLDSNLGMIVKPKFYIFENSLTEFDPKIRVNMETGKKNNDPTRSSEEFMAYSWKPQKDGQAKDEPMDKYDHAMDMIGYFFQQYQSGQMWRDIEFAHL